MVMSVTWLRGKEKDSLQGDRGRRPALFPHVFLRLSCLLVFLRNYHDPFNLIVLKSNFLFQNNEEMIYILFSMLTHCSNTKVK